MPTIERRLNMKRILAGLTLLLLCAGGVAAWAQQAPAADPLTARILELQRVYENVVTNIVLLDAQRAELVKQRDMLEGGIAELKKYRMDSMEPVVLDFPTTEKDLPSPPEEPTTETEPETEAEPVEE
jgi:hypothetical protein